MTELAYYTDTETGRFEAVAESVIRTEHGWDVSLSKTYFYPEGGGQPADTGTLGGLRVIDVRKSDGIVTHSLEAGKNCDFPAEGSIVEGDIDLVHRRDFMQQHSGQHLISAVMKKLGEIDTVSVHQGEDLTSIETSESEIATELLYNIEDEANRIINSNLPFRAHWTDAEGLEAFNLRRPSKHSSNIRIVEIPGVDCVACGGLHLSTTGGIGLIKYIRQEKIRGHVRTFWKIGMRASADYREKTIIVNELCRIHSSLQHEILKKTEAAAESFSSLKFDYGKLQREYAGLLAEKLMADSVKSASGLLIVSGIVENGERRFIDHLLKEFTSFSTPLLALIFNKSDEKTTWAAACSDDNCEKNGIFAFNDFRKELLPLIGGKGGGKAPIWQGIAANPGGIDKLIAELIKK